MIAPIRICYIAIDLKNEKHAENHKAEKFELFYGSEKWLDKFEAANQKPKELFIIIIINCLNPLWFIKPEMELKDDHLR